MAKREKEQCSFIVFLFTFYPLTLFALSQFPRLAQSLLRELSDRSAVGTDAGKELSLHMKGNMLLIIVAVVGLVGGGAGGYFASGMFGQKPASEQALADGEHGEEEESHGQEESHESEEEESEGSSEHGGGHGGGEAKADESQLGPFIVNLADSGARRYLRATMQLGLRKESYKKYFGKIDPRLRDALLLALSSRRTEQLLTLEGKAELREEIAHQINKIVGKDVVEEVYFVDFLIQ